jgi:hypothetical protein
MRAPPFAMCNIAAQTGQKEIFLTAKAAVVVVLPLKKQYYSRCARILLENPFLKNGLCSIIRPFVRLEESWFGNS